MFEKLMATAVLPASDIARAKQWWHDVLGRDPVYEDTEGEALFYDIGGTVLLVYRSEFAGTAQNTAFGLMTDDLDRDMTQSADARGHVPRLRHARPEDGGRRRRVSARSAARGSATARATSSPSASTRRR